MKRNTIQALAAMVLTALCAIALNGCTSANAATAEEPLTFRLEVTDLPQPEEPVGFSAIDPGKVVPLGQEQPTEPEQAWDEPVYYAEPVYYGGNDYGNPFKSDGVAYLDGREFNWYSQNVLPGSGLEELNANGRHVDESTGFVVDGDGYIAVASPWGQDEVGTVVDTPFGRGKVYDSNEGDAYDIYTDF